MAAQNRGLILLLLLFTFTFSAVNYSNAQPCNATGVISVYWGQNNGEGNLTEACATGNYQIVILEYLYINDDDSTPELNLASHCGDPSNPCSNLESEIKYCQSLNIKVLLSIGGDRTSIRSFRLRSRSRSRASSANDTTTQDVADYLYNNFLGGDPSVSGPLGNVSLDGIDFSDVAQGTNIHWADLARAINATTKDRKIYLSASPQCVYPDYYLGEAIETGLFDYIWVEFYYDPTCEYLNGDPTHLFTAWNEWTSGVLSNNSVFLGIPATPNATGSGYIEPEVLKNDILPTLKEASNYGGVMVWNRYFDVLSGDPSYSSQIKDSVPKACTNGSESAKFNILLRQY